MMIHNPLSIAIGDAEEMRAAADLLDKVKASLIGVYQRKTNRDAAEISRLMDAETWMTASEALELGFVDRVTESQTVAASAHLARFKNAPEKFQSIAASASALKPAASATPAKPSKAIKATKATEPVGADRTAGEVLPKGGSAMADQTQTPSPASYDDLKQSCVGADATFICSQLEAKATLPTATAAWMAEQNRRIEATRKDAEAQVAAARKEAEELKAKAQKPGVSPLGGAAKDEGDKDPIAAWNELVEANTKNGMTKGKAISKAVRDNPAAHRAYLVAFNAAHGRTME
jgi:hypothetical protein